MPEASAHDATIEKTLDLAALANVARGDRVQVQELHDDTDELFQHTLRLVKPRGDLDLSDPGPAPRRKRDRFLPENEGLRRLFLVAEAIGGYETLNDLINVYSPGQHLSDVYSRKASAMRLSAKEVRELEEYQEQLNNALASAQQYLLDNQLDEFSVDEIYDLHELLVLARSRSRQITAILGDHLMHEIEHQVGRLYEFTGMIAQVEESVSGVFMVNSEIMFVPTNELIHCVNTIFKAVGNPYLAKHIDGVLLLAARNLLIRVAAFYSYYGKQQIYKLFSTAGSTANTEAIGFRVRSEIRTLFKACRKNNKLMLTRVMANAEREFELSVEAIQAEATESAVETVKRMIPQPVPEHRPPVRGWIRRLFSWLSS